MTNEIHQTEWGYISYQPDRFSSHAAAAIEKALGPSEEQVGRSETAIVTKEPERYYILIGDWREELVGKSLAECLDIFSRNPDKHGWSSDELGDHGKGYVT